MTIPLREALGDNGTDANKVIPMSGVRRKRTTLLAESKPIYLFSLEDFFSDFFFFHEVVISVSEVQYLTDIEEKPDIVNLVLERLRKERRTLKKVAILATCHRVVYRLMASVTSIHHLECEFFLPEACPLLYLCQSMLVPSDHHPDD